MLDLTSATLGQDVGILGVNEEKHSNHAPSVSSALGRETVEALKGAALNQVIDQVIGAASDRVSPSTRVAISSRKYPANTPASYINS